MSKTLCSWLLFGALLVLPAGCGMTQNLGSQAQGSTVPGDTGRTRVVGSNSTVAGDAQATYDQQKWQLGPRR